MNHKSYYNNLKMLSRKKKDPNQCKEETELPHQKKQIIFYHLRFRSRDTA